MQVSSGEGALGLPSRKVAEERTFSSENPRATRLLRILNVGGKKAWGWGRCGYQDSSGLQINLGGWEDKGLVL